jgi:hypothetical protein
LVKLISEITSKKILLKIYQIILNENIKHTRNSNGIFINLNAVEPEKLEPELNSTINNLLVLYSFLCTSVAPTSSDLETNDSATDLSLFTFEKAGSKGKDASNPIGLRPVISSYGLNRSLSNTI